MGKTQALISTGSVAYVYATVLRNGSIRRVQAAFFLFNAEEYAVWIAVLIFEKLVRSREVMVFVSAIFIECS